MRPVHMLVHTQDYDVVYISYDEPDCEDNWARVRELIPTARRVHGVSGFDSAHKQAGNISSTKYIWTIDGDNWVGSDFPKTCVDISETTETVYSFPAINTVNGLRYGNGGIKLWPREVIMNMECHENASGDHSKIDFCWDWSFKNHPSSYSETRIGNTPEQAFRAGFREGIKLSTERGTGIKATDLPRKIPAVNQSRLATWCSVGNHTFNGDWCILGARYGVIENILDTAFDNSIIADYQKFQEYWSKIYFENQFFSIRHQKIVSLGKKIRDQIFLHVVDLTSEQSKFVYNNNLLLGIHHG